MKAIALATTFLLLASCMSIKPEQPSSANLNTYNGCVRTEVLGPNDIRVYYNFPDDATEVIIYRNGVALSPFRDKSVNSFLDSELEEGETYEYTCSAVIDDEVVTGSNRVEGVTQAVNPPSFLGIQSATILSPTDINITWEKPNGGASVDYYQIFVTRGSSSDFAVVNQTLEETQTSIIIGDLADEMEYSFSVRACNVNNICDTNTVTETLTTTDKGAPNSIGVTGHRIENGEVFLTVPWEEIYGGVKKRNIYRSTVNVAATILSNKILSTFVADLSNPETEVKDDNIVEGQVYYYIVRDEDPSGNENTNTSIYTVPVGDITPPNSFLGLESVTPKAPNETNVTLTFSTIGHEADGDVNGASQYLVYATNSDASATPDDSCSDGELVATIPATNYTQNTSSVTYDLSGLTSRKKYSFCMKAKDSSTNISTTNISKTYTMPDETAPSFDGLQTITYDSGLDQFSLTWNPATSAYNDQNTYVAKVWKNTTTPTAVDITELTFNHSTYSTGATFNKTDFSYSDGDTVYAIVNACDDANTGGLNFNAADNCTAIPTSNYKFRLIVDTTPPGPWAGVTSVTNAGQGALQVNWNLPAIRTDFKGFKFYHVEETSPGVYNKQLLDQINCTPDCVSSPITSHTVAISKVFQTYNIHVSAIDHNNIETDASTAPGSLSTFAITSEDNTKPIFNSSFSVVVDNPNSKVDLSWLSASDNQVTNRTYAITNNIYYEIYRKEGANFVAGTDYINDHPNPVSASITQIATGLTGNSFVDTDLGTLTEGQTYYYQVCARDESNNYRCDSIQSITVQDNTDPTVSARIADDVNSNSWDLLITADDLNHVPTEVSVKVWRKFATSDSDFPAASGAQFGSTENGQGTLGSPVEFNFETDQRAYDGTGKALFANYTIQATDFRGNVHVENFSYPFRAPSFGSAANASPGCVEDTPCVISVGDTLNPGVGLVASDYNTKVYIETAPTKGMFENCLGLDGTAITDTSCDYTPNLNESGADTVVLCAQNDNLQRTPSDALDAGLGCKTFNISISSGNDDPVAVSDEFHIIYSAGGNYNLPVTGNDTDTDGDIPVIRSGFSGSFDDVSDWPSGASINCTAGDSKCVLTMPLYTGQSDFDKAYGRKAFTYHIDDGNGGYSTITSYVTIYSANSWIGGTSNDSSVAANWCGSISSITVGCDGAGAAPTNVTDEFEGLVFDDDYCTTFCNPLIKSDIDTKTMFMTDSFSGTVTLDSSIELTAGASEAGRVILSGGTLDLSSGAFNTFKLKQNSGNTILAPTGNFSIDYSEASQPTDPDFELDGVFTHNNGTLKVVFNESSGAIGLVNLKTSGTKTFYNLVFDPTNNSDEVHIQGNFVVENNLRLERGTFAVDSGKLTVEGDLYLNYINSSYKFVASDTSIVYMTGTGKKIYQDAGAGKLDVVIDNDGTISAGGSSLTLNTLYIKDGVYQGFSGGETIISPDDSITNASFTYTGLADDGNIKGLVIPVAGAFDANNSKLTLKDTKLANGEGVYQVGINADALLELYDFEVNISDTSGEVANTFHRVQNMDGRAVISENTNIRITNNFTLTNGSIHGGDIDLEGDFVGTCTSVTSGPCAMGGSTNVALTMPGQSVTLASDATAPVMILNNGDTLSPSAGTAFSGVIVKAGSTLTAPAGSFRVGPEFGTNHKNEYGKIEYLFKVETGGVFNHNNGTIIFGMYGYTGSDVISDSNTALMVYTDGVSFYNLETDFHHTASSKGLCVDLQDTLIVENDYTHGAQCMRGQLVQVAGDLTFKQGASGTRHKTEYLTTDIEMNGTTAQSVGLNFSSTFMTLINSNFIVSNNSANVTVISDFAGHDDFAILNLASGSVFDNNSNNFPYGAQLGSGSLLNP